MLIYMFLLKSNRWWQEKCLVIDDNTPIRVSWWYWVVKLAQGIIMFKKSYLCLMAHFLMLSYCMLWAILSGDVTNRPLKFKSWILLLELSSFQLWYYCLYKMTLKIISCIKVNVMWCCILISEAQVIFNCNLMYYNNFILLQ